MPTLMTRGFSRLAAALLAAHFSNAYAELSFDLDFSGAVVTYSEGESTLSIRINDAANSDTTTEAPDVDIVIESLTAYTPDTPAKGAGTQDGGNNGSVASEDLRIHLNAGSSTRFRFSLLDGVTGQLFDTAATPILYGILVYDIDGTATAQGGADVLTIFSPVTYTLTTGTALDVASDPGVSVTFSDQDAGEVEGQVGLAEDDFGVVQQNVSVGLAFTIALWEFDYSIPNSDPNLGSGRNLLFDANTLSFTEDTKTTEADVAAAPVPSTPLLLLGGIGLLLAGRRRMRYQDLPARR